MFRVSCIAIDSQSGSTIDSRYIYYCAWFCTKRGSPSRLKRVWAGVERMSNNVSRIIERARGEDFVAERRTKGHFFALINYSLALEVRERALDSRDASSTEAMAQCILFRFNFFISCFEPLSRPLITVELKRTRYEDRVYDNSIVPHR